VVGTVIEHDSEIHHRKPGQIPARRRVLDSFFHRRNIVPGNGPAKNVVHEFKFSATWQRLHLDFAIAVLAVATGLLLVASLDIGAAANGFAIRHLRGFENYFRVVALLQF
jgi:hypothetical protein